MLIRDIAADASQKAANQVRPSEEKLAQIDEPAEENTWHEKPKGVSHVVTRQFFHGSRF